MLFRSELLSKYYAFKGWNSEGIPTRQTLEQLDLGYAADDLELRGILTPDAGVSACEPVATAEQIQPRTGGLH